MPTVDLQRVTFLMGLFIAADRGVLVCGGAGCGKSKAVNALLRSGDEFISKKNIPLSKKN